MTNQVKYVLTGGPGTGKTTTLNLIKSRGHKVIPEIATLVIKEFLKEGGIPKWDPASVTEFQKKFLRINASLESAIKESPICFLDRSVIDTIAYCKYYKTKLLDQFKQKAKEAKFSKIFFLDLLSSYKKTNIRKESFEEAKNLHHLIKETYQEFGYDIVEVPALERTKRVDFILNKISPNLNINRYFQKTTIQNIQI